MKQKELTALLALMFAFGAPVPELITVVSVACGLVFDAKSVSTEQELFAVLGDPSISHIVFEEHIIVESIVTINRKGRLALDLNGHNLISCGRSRGGFSFGKNRTEKHVPVIDVQAGNVEITGHGHVMALGAESPAIRIRGAMTAENENYASIAVSKDVIINAPNYYGIYIAPSGGLAYGLAVNFSGTMISRDGIYLSGGIQGAGANIPQINLLKGARILVDEHDGVALRAAGHGIWHIGKAEIAGGTGVIIQSGKLELDGSSIATAGELQCAEDEASTIISTGAIIQVEPSPNRSGDIEITISGGDYTSTKSYTFAETAPTENFQSFVIKSGQFAGESGIFYGIAPHGAEGAVTEISGGTFTSDVTSYLISGRYLEKDNKHHAYSVIDASKSRAEAKLAQAESDLQNSLKLAERFLDAKYSAGDLGDWRARLTPVLTVLKRTRTSVNKLLKSKSSADKLVSAIRSLTRATDNVQAVEDDLRAEVATAVASVEAVDPQDYSNYSYHELKAAATAASKILLQENPGFEAIYSALLDVEINIDLLEERTDDEVGLPTESVFKQIDVASTVEPVAPDLSTLPDSNTLAAASTTNEFHPELSLARIALGETMPKMPILKKTSLFDLPPVTTPTIKVDPELENSKSRLRTLLNDISSLDPAEYVTESYATLTKATNRAGSFLADTPISATSTTFNDLYADVEQAYYNLVKKADDPASVALENARINLLEMLDAVKDLRVNDYDMAYVEQFGELQVAIAKSEALLTRGIILPSEIVAAMDEITTAVSGLQSDEATSEVSIETPAEEMLLTDNRPVAESSEPVFEETPITTAPEEIPAVDWTALQDVVNDISRLNADKYTANSYTRVLECLETAKTLLADPATTQSQIDDTVFDLNLAMLALELNTPPRLSEYEQFNENSTDYYAVDNQPAAVQDNYVAAPVMNPATVNESGYYAPSETNTQNFDEADIEPNWLMSMMAGAYAGIAAYRRSRLIAKQNRHKNR